MTYTVSGGALNSTQTIGKHLLTYLGPIVLGSCLPLHKWLSIKFTTALDISKKRNKIAIDNINYVVKQNEAVEN